MEEQKDECRRAGTIASAIYNSKRTKESRSKALTPVDFFPFLKERSRTEGNTEKMRLIAKLIHARAQAAAAGAGS